jgi:hypothetical protein
VALPGLVNLQLEGSWLLLMLTLLLLLKEGIAMLQLSLLAEPPVSCW